MAWNATAMQIALGYAASLICLHFLNVLNRQIAYTKARDVDLSEEVIVITGGASGLGLLIAEVYGMRGATVAVLDVRDLESGEARGVTSYKCDVSDIKDISRVAFEIERDVSLKSHRRLAKTDLAAWNSHNPHQQRWNCQWQTTP